MARLSDFVSNKSVTSSAKDQVYQGTGRRLWNEVFGNSTAEERGKQRASGKGGWGRSIVGSDAATIRLVEAMRSRAPGGWSDDRWEQAARHFNGIAYVCIHRIATQWMQSEFAIFRKDTKHEDGRVRISPEDPPEGDRLVRPYQLVKLLEKPNWKDSFGKWLYRLAQQKYLTGTALTWMLPNAMGVPMELYSIPTALAIPQPVINPEYPHGYYRIQPVYPYGPFSSYPTPSTAVGAPIPGQWMLKMQFPHPLFWYDGYSPLTAMRFHLDEIEMMDRSRHYKMRRSFNPSAVLNMTGVPGSEMLPDAELLRIKTEWENNMMGPENHGGLTVSPPGTELEEFGSKPIEMDYSEGWNQLVAFAMAGFGITKPAAGMVEDSSYATLFATLKQLYLLTIKPDVDDVASELTRHLAPFFGDDLIIDIRTPRVDDHDVKNAKLQLLCQNKGITLNELRKELEMEVTKENWGNQRVGEEPQQGPPGMPGGGPGSGMMPGVGPATNQMLNTPPAPPEAQAQPPEITNSQPTPGPLGEGALGPRKNLDYLKRLAKVSTNGHAGRFTSV